MDLTRRKNTSSSPPQALIEKVYEKEIEEKTSSNEIREDERGKRRKKEEKKRVENGSSSSSLLSEPANGGLVYSHSCASFVIVWALLCSGLVLVLEQDKILPKKTFLSSPSDRPVKPPEHKIDKQSKIQPALQAEKHPDANIRGLPFDLTSWPHGAMGLGIVLDEAQLTSEEKLRRRNMYERHAFDEYVSELIPSQRSLPDWRTPWCKKEYPETASEDGQLTPFKTSIIICFHNEAWSTLIRSLHSVLDRTPAHLLEEIVLVDDASTMEHLGQRLDDYIRSVLSVSAEVRIEMVRLRERQGLIRSRMEGIRASQGKVLTFLDSHIEASPGWLEPLLYRIKRDQRVIATPVIDSINDTSFHYQFINQDLFGMINWRLDFEWHQLNEAIVRRKPDPFAPHSTPVMAGGLFAIHRDWFEKLGWYDEGMDIWGGENLELSFKTWMCGGWIEIVPCSRVGHVFRSWTPYKLDTTAIQKNNVRVAQIWMDRYKYLYFDRLGHFKKPMEDRLKPYGDISSRLALRQSLDCKDFAWFLTHVGNALPVFEPLLGAGEISNPESGLCLDKPDSLSYEAEMVDMYPCHDRAGNQYWIMDKNGFLTRDFSCIGVLPDGVTVALLHCNKAGPWEYNPGNGRLKYHQNPDKCMTILSTYSGVLLELKNCDETDPRQEFAFTKFDAKGMLFEQLMGPPTKYKFIE